VVMAASLLAMAPVLLLFVVLQRRVIDGLASSGLK
jgi:multiple sugar transport system permease protein